MLIYGRGTDTICCETKRQDGTFWTNEYLLSKSVKIILNLLCQLKQGWLYCSLLVVAQCHKSLFFTHVVRGPLWTVFTQGPNLIEQSSYQTQPTVNQREPRQLNSLPCSNLCHFHLQIITQHQFHSPTHYEVFTCFLPCIGKKRKTSD